ncbi:hypothetical protein EPUS_08447 [Endocarpon pusillum Z07020]|uniref:DUF7730 domain-containing protein n=1 Tax=Endocarpon pusillum (strain Z07020 / HMAS-L-300199) TaxID=1263415 RepID=U1GD63_ENDPU|nr:uncharacterized protein EPUS_08447 [Endocarpon pusillum Z07020]ERF75542.1 hypothetical protein EPUS_08447 [Endocarpon pusillum Z07020]
MNNLTYSSAIRPSTQPAAILANTDNVPLTEDSLVDRQYSLIPRQTPLQILQGDKPKQAFDDRATAPLDDSTPNLLGIDLDSRLIILDCLLVNRNRRVIDKKQKHFGEVELEGPAQDIDYLEYGHYALVSFPCLPCTTNQLEIIRTKGPTSIAGAQILRVCRQLYREGVPILYGKNSFVSSNGRSFNDIWRRATPLNTSLIKNLTVDISIRNTDDIGIELELNIKSLEQDLPSLCELTLMSKFADPHRQRHGKPPHTKLEAKHRTILCTAVDIALHHATLGTAIWDARSRRMSPDELIGGLLAYEEDQHQLAVRILARDHAVKLKEHRRQYPLPGKEEVITKDFVLDCHAITQVRLAHLIGMSPSDFALPDGSSAAVIPAS